MDLLHPMRWSKAELLKWDQTEIDIWRKRSLRKREMHGSLLLPGTFLLEKTHWCLGFPFSNSLLPLCMRAASEACFDLTTNALLTSLFSQQVGIFDTLIRKARTCGILAKSSAVPHWCHAIQWRHIVKSSLRKRTWRSGNRRWSAFGFQT